MKGWRIACASLFCFVACVRLSEPEIFKCNEDADCLASEKCLRAECRAKDACNSSFDCSELQNCLGDRCIDLECRNDTHCGELDACRDTVCVPVDCRDDSHCAMGVCVGYTCVQCASDADCAGYTCDDNVCSTTCQVDANCAYQYVCVDEVCVSVCPGQPDGVCLTVGAACTASDQCGSGNCCEEVSSGEPTCRSQPCPSGWEVCTAHADCTEGMCIRERCVVQPEGCETCGELPCCMAEDGTRSCGEDGCPVITGDFCIVDGCDNGGWCQNPVDTLGDGVCTRGCDGGCGVNSRGTQNVCAPSSGACRPGCSTELDCDLVHPDLTCVQLDGLSYCEFL